MTPDGIKAAPAIQGIAKRSRIALRHTAGVLLLTWLAVPAGADYVGSLVNRIFVDPASIPVVTNGYGDGDVVSFILETTPADTGSDNGHAAWMSVYIPRGAEVVNAEFVLPATNGGYDAIPAEDTDDTYDGWGSRGAEGYGPTTGATQLGEGYVNEVQQDTGIFYSTDVRARLVVDGVDDDCDGTPDLVSPTGVPDQLVFNRFDFDHTKAFGEGFVNGGNGNTPLRGTGCTGDDGVGCTWTGVGSIVAGPDTYYTNDYNPGSDDCSDGAGGDFFPGCDGDGAPDDFLAESACVGPWQRIAYPNSKLGGSNSPEKCRPGNTCPPDPFEADATVIQEAYEQGEIRLTTLPTSAGWDFATDGALPSGNMPLSSNSSPETTYMVRFVHGKRRLGELENARITLRIIDSVQFNANVFIDDGTAEATDDETFCLDSTGGDTSDTAAKDNPFRYYEPQHQCSFLAGNGVLFKETKFVNNEPSNGASLSVNDVVSYRISFTNSSGGVLTDIDLYDRAEDLFGTPTPGMSLLEPGNPLCAWPSYDGDLPGPSYNAGSAAGGTATWTRIASLAAGAQVNVFLCAEITAGGVNDRRDNSALVDYSFSPMPADRVVGVKSTTGGTISTLISGAVYADADGSGTLTALDGPLGDTTVSLYVDVNGNGMLDGGDTFVDSVRTLSDGSYAFAGIAGGDYIVVETDRFGWSSTGDKDNPGTCGSGNGCNTIGTITVAAGGASTLNDFFDWPPNPADVNTITGTVFADADQDALRDPGEGGQPGILVRLYRDNNLNGQVDLGDTLIQTQQTAVGGGYSFAVAETGAFVLEIDTATLPFGSSLTTDNVETASFADFGNVDPDNDFGYFGGVGTAGEICFAVADSVDQLVAIDFTSGSPVFIDIGPTGTSLIEAIALQPGTNVLYGSNANQLGTLNQNTGAFTAIGPAYGTCSPPGGGSLTVNDVDGLTFDPYTGILWGSERESGDDLLLQIDPATGTVVPNAFGPGVSCVRVPTSAAPGGRVDLDDIAIDPSFFGLSVPRAEMYAISNSGGVLDRLIRINKATGAVTDVGALGVGDMEGLGFDDDGTLYGTTGGSSNVTDNALWTIPKTPPPSPGLVAVFPSYGDYEAVDCTTGGSNLIEGTVFVDLDGDALFELLDGESGWPGIDLRLYIDENNDGLVDAGDSLIQTTSTDASGRYRFFVASEGNFVLESVFPGNYPAGSSLTTDNVEEADFIGLLNADLGNDFGFRAPSDLAVTKTSSASGDVAAGDLIDYTVTVTNTTITRQTGISVFDPVPAGTSYVAQSTVATGPISGGVMSTTLTAVADTYIREDQPGDNFGDENELRLLADPPDDRRSLVRWDLSGIPAGANVISATMRFYVTRERGGATVNVHRLTQQWAEGNGTNGADADWIHWDEGAAAPPADEWATPGGDFSVGSSGSFMPDTRDVYESVDVQTLVQAWVDGAPNHGVILLSDLAQEVRLGARTSAGEEPMLDVTYELVTTTTKDNAPGGLIADLFRGDPVDLVVPADFYLLDPGDSLTVTFQVRVDDPVDPSLTRILNEVTASSDQSLPRRAQVSDPLSRGGAIGDRVWLDVDGDGIQDIGEPGLANVEVALYDVGGDGMAGTGDDVQVGLSQLTGADGGYLFDRLAPGTYYVDVADGTVPAGLVLSPGNTDPPTSPLATPTFTVSAEEIFLTADFGYTTPPGTAILGDFVWNDIDRDGIQDAGEVGLAGVTLDLLSAGPDGVLGTADDVAEATQTTGADGSYLFTAVPPGEYLVRVTDTGGVLSGFSATMGPQSVGDGTSSPTLVLAGEIVDDLDFGYSPGACLPRIDFETDAAGNPLVAGEEIDNQWASWGVTVSFTVNSDTGPAMIFDSANPTGGDVDLGSPNETCVPPGPGIGTEGEVGQPGENCFPLGNILIISEDGDSGDPDDAAGGGSLSFSFASDTGVNALTFLDAENNQDSVEVLVGTYRDEFGAVSYANSDGTLAWTPTPWTETNDDGPPGTPGAGSIFVNAGGELQLEGTGGNPERIIERPIDLSGATEALLSFDWRCVGDMEQSGAAQDTVHVEISADGGGSWITLESKVGEIDMCLEPGDADSGSDSFDLAALFDGDPSDSRLRFRYTISAADEDFFVDNVEVRGRLFFDNLTAPGDNAFERLPVGVSAAREVIVTFPASGSVASLDFCLGSLRDKVWFDANGDGLFQLSEAGIANVTVTLVSDPDGVPDSGDEVVVATTTTDTDGDFGFDGLEDGNYRILITDTTAELAGLGGTTAPAQAENLGVTVSGGDDVLGINFGYNPPGTIGDTIFSDADGDGLQGPGEPGIAGVTVELYEDTDGDGVFDSTVDQQIGSVVTDGSGSYLFEGLVTGTYFASVDDGQAALAGYLATTTDEELGANAAGTQIEVVLAFNGDSRLDADFGYRNTGLADISGNVFEDLDIDGVDDGAGEPGFGGVTIELLDATGTVVATTVTDTTPGSVGDYLFPDLAPGDYTVRVTDDAQILDGYMLTSGLDEIDVTVAAADVDGIDFGYVRQPGTGSIGDTLWLDVNGDGFFNEAESGLAGVAVALYEDLDGDGVFEPTVSVIDGRIDMDGDGDVDAFDDGELGLVGVIDGRLDLDGDGDIDAADAGTFNGVTVIAGELDLDGDGTAGETNGEDTGVLAGDDGMPLSRTITDANGNYLFPDLPPGRFFVDVDETTLPDSTPDGVPDLDETTYPAGIDPAAVIALSEGEDYNDADFGYVPRTGTAVVGDRIWYDADSDGLQDPGEVGIGGVLLELTDGVCTPMVDCRTAVTGADGSYYFTGLAPGDYDVTYDASTLPAGYNTIPTNNDGEFIYTFSVAAGDAFLHLDFGFDGGATGTIGDRLWLDENGDGFRDAGEPGIAGVTIDLYEDTDGDGVRDPGEPILATTTTAADGSYRFSGLPLDDGGGDADADYLVSVSDVFGVLTGLNLTDGADDTDDNSQVDPYAVAVSAGTPNIPWADFGFAPSAGNGSLGSQLWHDVDGDGLFEPTVAVIDGRLDMNGDGTIGAADDGVLGGVTVIDGELDLDGNGTIGAGDTGPFKTATVIAGLLDLDGDGTAGETNGDDSGTLAGDETGFQGVTIQLWLDDGDGVFEPFSAEDNLLRTATTDSNGEYEFYGLPHGTYFVTVTDLNGVLVGFEKTTGPMPGDDDNSQADPYRVTLSSAEPSNVTADFGYEADPIGPMLSIAGTVFEDDDKSAALEPGEGLVGGAVVELYRYDDLDMDGEPDPGEPSWLIGSTITDAGGDYLFTDLPPGDYFLTSDTAGTPADGFIQTTQASTGGVEPVTLVAADVADRDFGYWDGGIITTPVTLAYFEATGGGGLVSFRWSTATELGNLGFNLYAVGEEGLELLNEDLIESHVVDSIDPQHYEYEASGVRGELFLIEDVDILGQVRHHGPFELSEPAGTAVPEVEPIDWASIRRKSESKRALRAKRRGSGYGGGDGSQAVTAGSAAVGVKRWPGVGGPSHRYAPVRLEVDGSGLYRVRYEDLLAAGIDWTGAPLAQVALTRAGEAVPVRVEGRGTFGPGAFFEFVGEALKTLYTRTNVYRLELDKRQALRVDEDARWPSGAPAESYLERSKVERNLRYHSSSPTGDPWYEKRLLATSKPVEMSIPLELDSWTGAGPVTLSVVLWGVTDFPAAPDHHVAVEVNGVQLGERWFDGLREEIFELEVPESILAAEGNTLTIRLPHDTKALYDLVNFDFYEVSYPRALQASEGRLTFTGAGDSFRVEGLGSSDVEIYRVSDGRTARLTAPLVTGSPGAYAATFAGSAEPATYYVTTAESVRVPRAEPARRAVDLGGRRAELLIISHPDFIDGLEPLVEARRLQGWSVGVVDVEDLYEQFAWGIVDPEAIRAYIGWASSNLGTRSVLLVGGDTYDYHDYLGLGAVSFIPSLYAQTDPIVKYAPVDPLYTDVDSDGIPDLAIGRLPVRSPEELEAVIGKTLEYPGVSSGSAVVVAADAYDVASGYSFKAASDEMGSLLPAEWGVARAYIDDLGLAAAREMLLKAMRAGAPLVSYFGHSGPSVWSFDTLFSSSDVDSLENSGRPMVVTQWGCWNTYYVSPSNETLANRLLLGADHGAAAVLGASTLTEAQSERLLGRLVFRNLAEPGISLGEAVQEAKRELAETRPELTDVILGWTLLGDPTLVLRPAIE